MYRKLFRRLMILLLVGLALGGCQGSDDSGEADENPDDDDQTGDDDDAGLHDYGKDPLAVIFCETGCAEVGETIAFVGLDSTDPEDSELTYEFDFGDGQTASGPSAEYAYSRAGAYRTTLTVTNQIGYVDSSSCIIAVGKFPAEVGEIDAIDFKPNWYDPEIRETAQEKREHGGVFWGTFVSPVDAVPDTILVNDQIYNHENPGDVQWCEVNPAELTAGQVAQVRCHSYQPIFDAGQTVTLEVRAGERTIWRGEGLLKTPLLSPSYITASVDGSEILVHVRNDDPVRTLGLTGLLINGLDVTDFVVIDNPEVRFGRTATIRIPQCSGIDYYDLNVYTVRGIDGERELSVTRPLRLFPPKFYIGNWNGSDGEAFTDPEQYARHRAAGIDTFIWNPGGALSPEFVFDFAERHDLFIWSHVGDFAEGDGFTDLVREWGDQPRWVMNAISGEADGSPPAETLDKLHRHRKLWDGRQRLWIYNNCANHFPTWGALADFGGMDHYCVMAPKCNVNPPPFYWDEIDMAGRYTEAIRRAAEPNPVINWTQSMFNVFDIEFAEDPLQVRCTTADEIRAQWYEVLGYGSKSIFWFLFRKSWYDICEPEAEIMHGTLAAELRQVERIVLEGDASIRHRSLASAGDELIDVNTIVAPAGLLITLINLDYDLRLIRPWVWNEKTDVVVTVTPPVGLEPAAFYLLAGSDKIELTWRRESDTDWRFELPSLKVAEAVFVEPEP